MITSIKLAGWVGALIAAIQLDERTVIPIGTALVVGTGVWYLSAKLTRLEAGQAEINRRLDALPCANCKPPHK